MRISDWSSDVCSSDLVKVADALPHPPGGRGNDGRGVDFRHASVVLLALLRLGLLGEALGIARRAEDVAHARHVGALDADLLHHLVDQRRLGAIAQGAFDHLVGRRAMAAAAVAAEAVDVKDLDRKSTRLNSSHSCAYRMPS